MTLTSIIDKAILVGPGTDMEGHMGSLRKFASQCERIIEFGVYDCTSTWALLAGGPKWMRSYDIARRAEVSEVEQATAAAGIEFQFILASSLEVSIEETDLLFIDSLHTYAQMKAELALHAGKVRKFILAHDTTTFGDVDQFWKGPGLWPAIREFLDHNPEWQLRERYTHCHGLTVLARHG